MPQVVEIGSFGQRPVPRRNNRKDEERSRSPEWRRKEGTVTQ